ncbi:autoinducer-2 (AI-2) kinase [compost metagenome]
MLAGVACEIYTSIEEAEQVFIKIKQTYYPDLEKHRQYAKWYRRYKKCYEAAKEVLAME